MSTLLRPLPATLALTLAFALACAGPPSETQTAGAGGGTSEPSVVTPTPAGGGFAAIKARGALKVAADPDAAPFLSKGADGAWEGYEYAIMRALADRVGVDLVVVDSAFAELTGKVEGGAADLAIGQIAPSEAYSGVAWSVSYLQYSLCLVAPAASPVATMADLKGKRVAMYDDPVARQVTDLLVSASYERVLFEDYGYFEKMVRGQLDAMVYDCPLARHEMAMYGDKLRVVSDALNISTYNVAVPAGDATLLNEVNVVLKELGDQGLLGALEARWLGAAAPVDGYESATGKVIVVKRGESLSAIAVRELGNTDAWRALYDANKDVVGPNPNEIYAGMRLRVPRGAR